MACAIRAVGFERLSLPPVDPPADELFDLGKLRLAHIDAADVVVLEPGGKPIHGARVELLQAGTGFPIARDGFVTWGRSNARGHVRLELPPDSGMVLVRVDAEGHSRLQAPFDANDLREPWIVHLSGGTPLELSTISATGTPLPGALVRWLGEPELFVAGHDGRLVLPVVPPGPHDFEIVAREIGRAYLAGEPFDGRSISEERQLVIADGKQAGAATLVGSATCSVAIDCTERGTGLAGAKVTLVPTSDSTRFARALEAGSGEVVGRLTTNSMGRATARELVPGEWTAFLEHPERPGIERVDFQLDGEFKLVKHVPSSFELVGSVEKLEPNEARDVHVWFTRLSRALWRRQTDAHTFHPPVGAQPLSQGGSFVLDGVPMNEDFRVVAHHPERGFSISKRIHLRPEELTQESVQLERPLKFSQLTCQLDVSLVDDQGQLAFGEWPLEIVPVNSKGKRRVGPIVRATFLDGITTSTTIVGAMGTFKLMSPGAAPRLVTLEPHDTYMEVELVRDRTH